MSWFSDTVSGVNDFFTGDRKKENKADELRQQAKNIKNKSAAEIQNEGRAVAGQAASDKAGIAKRQAKAASMMANGNRLQAATNASSAATNAATEGYDTASQAYSQMAQQSDLQQKEAERQALLNQANAQDTRTENQKNRRSQMFNTALSVAGGLASSDKNKKSVKHTYIPADKRVKKGE